MRCLLKASEIRGSRSAERGIQMKKQQSAIRLVLLAMGATLYLMSRPQCGPLQDYFATLTVTRTRRVCIERRTHETRHMQHRTRSAVPRRKRRDQEKAPRHASWHPSAGVRREFCPGHAHRHHLGNRAGKSRRSFAQRIFEGSSEVILARLDSWGRADCRHAMQWWTQLYWLCGRGR